MKIAVLSVLSDRFLVEWARVFREIVLGFAACGGGGGGFDWSAIVLVEVLWRGFLDVTEADIV